MPRPCSICSSEDRDQVDSLIAAGAAQATVAARYGFTQSSVSRHVSRHLGNGGMGSLSIARARADVAPADLLDVLCSVLDNARAIQESAVRAGRSSLALQAGGSIREIVKVLRDLLGTNDDPLDVVADLRELSRLADYLRVAIQRHPNIGAELANVFDENGDEETATSLRRLADSSQKSLDLKWQGR